MHEACIAALKKCEKELVPGNKIGNVFDIHAKTFDDLGFKKARMNACGYSLGATFSPNWMDWPMLYEQSVCHSTWKCFLHAHDINGLRQCISYEFRRNIFSYRR